MNTALTTLKVVITFALVAGFGWQDKAWGGSASKDQAAVTAAATSALASSPQSGTEANHASADGNGPTVLLDYGQGSLQANPMQSFMYFVPLISPVAVDRGTSDENHQQVSVVSYEKKVTLKSFYVTCVFEIKGCGFSRYTFDPAGMIALRIAESKKSKPDSLSNVLDYIHFEGEGFGGIQIKGTIDGSTETVTQVDLEFNARGRKSPVTIGLYELKSKNGRYCYENRSNQIVARVNSLTFKRSEKGSGPPTRNLALGNPSQSRNGALGDPDPRMGISVASISKKGGSNGPIGQLKAAIANLFIKPVLVTALGNQALLDFGYALFEQKPTFTFPKAANLREATILAAEPSGQ
jgi:hypothetical protein